MTLPADILQGFSDELVKISEDAKEKEIDVQAIKRKVELWSRMRSSSDVPVDIREDAAPYGGGYYDNKTKSIALSSKDHESLAHELGHAEMDKSIFGKTIQHSINRKLFPWTPVAGAIGGSLLSKGKNWGALLPILTAAPTLLSEWLATRSGARRLEDIGATPGELETYRKNLSDSFSTYHDVIPKTLLAGGAGYVVG